MSRGLRPPALMQLPSRGTVTSPWKCRVRHHKKRMGKKGTLTIPQHLRHELGLDGGTAVDLTPTGDGGLVIQKHRPTCNICQGTYEVVTFRGFQICRECFLGIREEVEKLG